MLMITLVPLILTIQSIAVFAAAATSMKLSDLNSPFMQMAIKKFQIANPDVAAIAGLSDMDKFLIFTYLQFPIYLMLIPVLIASVIMTFSVVEEKQTRTLEPLLATPVRTWELLLGKILAGSVPAIAISWACGAVFLAAVAVTHPAFLARYNGAAYWLIFMLLLVPLMTALSSAIGIIASAKATDAKNAQGLAIIVILPVLALIGLNSGGILPFSILNQLLVAAVILAAAVIAMRAAVSMFQRETILSKWKF
jgi:ABC-2 type transport system permease protein